MNRSCDILRGLASLLVHDMIPSDQESLQAARMRGSPLSAGDPSVFGASSSSTVEEDMGGGDAKNQGGGRGNGSGVSTPNTSFFEELKPENMGQFLSEGWFSDEAHREEATPMEEDQNGGADESSSSSPTPPIESLVIPFPDHGDDDTLFSPHALHAARQIRAIDEGYIGEDEGDNHFNPDMRMNQESALWRSSRANLKKANEDSNVVKDGGNSRAGIVVKRQKTHNDTNGCGTGPVIQWEQERPSAFETVVQREVPHGQMKPPPAALSAAAAPAPVPPSVLAVQSVACHEVPHGQMKPPPAACSDAAAAVPVPAPLPIDRFSLAAANDQGSEYLGKNLAHAFPDFLVVFVGGTGNLQKCTEWLQSVLWQYYMTFLWLEENFVCLVQLMENNPEDVQAFISNDKSKVIEFPFPLGAFEILRSRAPGKLAELCKEHFRGLVTGVKLRNNHKCLGRGYLPALLDFINAYAVAVGKKGFLFFMPPKNPNAKQYLQLRNGAWMEMPFFNISCPGERQLLFEKLEPMTRRHDRTPKKRKANELSTP